VIRRLGLMLTGVLLAFLALEVALRLSDAVPEVGSPLYSFHESDPALGWRGRPNVRLRYHRPEFDTLVQLDAEGWRQPDPPRPADAAQRILVLGDSFTWGWGVSQGEALTDRLQARLAPTVAIYNRGVIGFGTAQEYLLLKRELAANTYEAVVLMFFINDLNDNGDGKDGHRPYFELVDGQLLPRNQPALARTSPLQLFLKDHSRAYLFVEFELGMLKRRFRGETDDERLYREKAAVDFHDLPGYAVTARLLEEMNRLVREHGARFFLVYVPQRGESDLDAPHPYVRSVHAMIDDITRRAGIPMIDLAPVFRQQVKAGHELVYPIDAHWNRTGHALAADVLLSSPIFASYDGAAGRDARRRGAVASTDASTVRR
jgi:GDSL-like Lipase/Acylhydrolase family